MDAKLLEGLSAENTAAVMRQFRKYYVLIRKLQDENRKLIEQNRLTIQQVESGVNKTVADELESTFSCCICNEVIINVMVLNTLKY